MARQRHFVYFGGSRYLCRFRLRAKPGLQTTQHLEVARKGGMLGAIHTEGFVKSGRAGAS